MTQTTYKNILDNENLDLILDNLQIGIIAHTPERIITFFNREAERITGYLREDVVNRDCHEVFEQPFCGDKCSFCDGIPEFTSRKIEYPLTIISKDGVTHHVEMTVTPVMNKDNLLGGVIASFREIADPLHPSLASGQFSNFAGIIGKDKSMQDIFRQIQDVALYHYPVHISGDTGTGKERVANAIHDISSYGNGAFVPVNCGAIPEGVVESELFGHVKGAFTGAVKERKGRFELANKGTLFLDEVAELPLKTQVKLLRFLQEGSFEKVGGEKRVVVDVRIISASNKTLKEEVKKGKFREDLYYRLSVIPIHLPPLRERKSDIPLLTSFFLKEAAHETGNEVSELSGDALDAMLDYHWPGNVREIKNVIQFAVVKSRGRKITPDHLPPEIPRSRESAASVSENPPKQEPVLRRGKLDTESVRVAIEKTGGNKSKAARLLGVGRATLYRFLERHSDIKEFADQL